MHLPCRALAGAWCFVRCTSDSCFHYFTWNSAGVPDCSWHDREVKHLQRKRFGLYSGGIEYNLQFYPFCLCFTLWFGWLILGRYLQELVWPSKLLFHLVPFRRLKHDSSAQPPPSLSLPHAGTPICARSSQCGSTVCSPPSSLVELHPGMNLAHCTCFQGPKG